MKRTLLTLMALILALTPLTHAEESLEAANARIAELEAQLAQKDARIAELESLLGLDGEVWGAEEEAAAEFTGGIITVSEARAEYEYRASFYSALGDDLQDVEAILKQEVLESLVEDAILKQKAEEAGLYPLTEADLMAIDQQAQAAYEETVTYYQRFRGAEGITEEEVRQDTIEYLTGQGYTLDSVKSTLINQTWRDRLQDWATQGVEVTEDDLRAYYQEEARAQQTLYESDDLEYEYARMEGQAVLWNPEGFRRVQALLIGFDDDTTYEMQALNLQLVNAEDESARAEIQARIDQLFAALDGRVSEVLGAVAAGADFTALIDTYSDDDLTRSEPIRSEGYYISASSQVYMREIVDAAMALSSPGDVSEPVRTEMGVYILKYVTDVPAGQVPYEEARTAIAESARAEIKARAYNETVERWLQEAFIIYYPERI